MKKFYVPVILVLLFCFCGCKKAGNPAEPSGTVTESPDWTAVFGGQSAPEKEAGKIPGAGMTPKPTEDAGKMPKPTKTPEEKRLEILASLGYPTVVPPREFTPENGQTELVLWLSFWGTYSMDDHIVAELNHILQERGYSFYLTVKTEPATKSGELSPWQEIFDAGEMVDLVSVGNGDMEFWKTYGKTGMERMITGGCLLPFSEYPDTPAKDRLRAAYGEEYWRLCSFGGEIYGVSNYLLQYALGKKYLLLNLDAAEQAGIGIPEEIDLLHMDEILEAAKAAGVPGIGTNNMMVDYYGAKLLPCGLFIRCLPDGEYSFVNPFEDGEILEVCDAMNRYRENGWVEYEIGKLPLVMCVTTFGDIGYLEDGRFVLWEDGKEQSASVKVYEAGDHIMREGDLRSILGISSASRHKEEALELLCLMHTDEEIVQLLRYGLEGIHYRLGEDGLEEVKTIRAEITDGNRIAYSIKTWEYPGVNTLGNPRMPLEFDETAGVRHRDNTGFYGDIGGVSLISYPWDLLEGKEEQMEKIRKILYVESNKHINLYSLEGLWQKSKTAYRQELERMRIALEEAGYNELIAELNQRLEEK